MFPLVLSSIISFSFFARFQLKPRQFQLKGEDQTPSSEKPVLYKKVIFAQNTLKS